MKTAVQLAVSTLHLERCIHQQNAKEHDVQEEEEAFNQVFVSASLSFLDFSVDETHQAGA